MSKRPNRRTPPNAVRDRSDAAVIPNRDASQNRRTPSATAPTPPLYQIATRLKTAERRPRPLRRRHYTKSRRVSKAAKLATRLFFPKRVFPNLFFPTRFPPRAPPRRARRAFPNPSFPLSLPIVKFPLFFAPSPFLPTRRRSALASLANAKKFRLWPKIS